MLPDSALLKDDPQYFRRLLRRCELTYAKAGELLGVEGRTIANYVKRGGWPYAFQYTLEVLAHMKEMKRFHFQPVETEIR